ncbi:2-polyprenyl-3-methyl-6-methoxy-1,4-benzoquinone monooxygenase [Thauera sp. ZXT1-4]|jgi:ubiquinone biosynthesis monooxygenase Coq7
MMIDQAIIEFDKALRTVFAQARSVRPLPGDGIPESEMSDAERAHAAALMRVNHVGEVCAQALYQGQAIMSRDAVIRDAMREASQEETEHLAWTERRISELGGRKSLLNPVWYGGALALGMLAGRFGERWNLGFLAETERQVEQHLKGHLDTLPPTDQRSRAIVEQMKVDEAEHAEMAVRLGAHALPAPARTAMKLAARVMTTLAYRV